MLQYPRLIWRERWRAKEKFVIRILHGIGSISVTLSPPPDDSKANVCRPEQKSDRRAAARYIPRIGGKLGIQLVLRPRSRH
jgi:hypothetical protein